MTAWQSKATNPPLGPGAVTAGHRSGVSEFKILSPAEEFRLADRLGKQREEIRRLIDPLCQDAPEGTRLSHFDQMVAYYGKLHRVRKSLANRIEKLLAEYNEIKHALVLANVAWVTKLSRTHHQLSIAEEDLFQDGVCGLLKAIDRFEPERGLRLMSYATWYIREAMQQARARQSHVVSLSTHDLSFLRRLESSRSVFQHEHEREPSVAELGMFVGRNPQYLSRLQRATSPTVSLERSREEGSISIVVDDPASEFDQHEEIDTAVTRLLKALPSRERMVVTCRFGLEGQEPASLEVLGGALQVSKERVRQIQCEAIGRMKQFAAKEQFELIEI